MFCKSYPVHTRHIPKCWCLWQFGRDSAAGHQHKSVEEKLTQVLFREIQWKEKHIEEVLVRKQKWHLLMLMICCYWIGAAVWKGCGVSIAYSEMG